MCGETSELGLGTLKDCLCIIEQLIVSKLVSHLLAEYARGSQSLAESVFFSPPPLFLNSNLLKYCTQTTGEPAAQIAPNFSISAMESRGCRSFQGLNPQFSGERYYHVVL